MTKLILVVFACLLAAFGYAAEAPLATDNASPVTRPNPAEGMTAAQEAAAIDAINAIKVKHEDIFGAGNIDLYKEILARRTAENDEFLSRIRAFNGSDPDADAAKIEIGGGLELTGRWRKSPRHMRETRFIGPSGQFDIITANENLLDDENRALNRITNKIEKSKFACGNFDWVVQLKHNFTKAALTKYVDKLAESAIAAAPMALLANFSPTLYEIVKWLRLNAADLLNADKLNCTNMENAMTNVGQRMLRGEGYAECFKANKALGVGEAHRICNQENSPWDGVENVVGEVVGFNGTTPEISLTKMLGDKLKGSTPVGLAAAQERQRLAQKRFTEAQAVFAANPDPGDVYPPEGNIGARRQWIEAKTRFVAARDDLANAQKNLDSAIKATNNVTSGDGDQHSAWSVLRRGIADNLPDIIGDITLSAKADIQFGRQRQYQLMLKYKHTCNRYGLELTDKLRAHFEVIRAVRPDRDALADSYDLLRSFCYAAMQAPWQTDQMNDIRDGTLANFGDEKRDVSFGYDTFDKAAYLWVVHQGSPEGAVERLEWPGKYRFIEWINHVAAFEVYDYLFWKGREDVGSIVAEMRNLGVSKGPGGERIPKQVEEALNEYLAMLLRKRNEQIRPLMETTAAVNGFQLQRLARSNEYPERQRPVVTRPPIQLGR